MTRKPGGLASPGAALPGVYIACSSCGSVRTCLRYWGSKLGPRYLCRACLGALVRQDDAAKSG